MGVNRDYVADPPERGVALAEDPAVAAAVTDRDHKLRVRGGGIGPFQRDLHVDGYRACHQQHVGKTRGGGEVDTEPLAVVDSVVHGVELQFTAVARSGIDLANGETAVKGLSDPIFQLGADDGDFGLDPGREWLGDDAGAEYLVENPQHVNLTSIRLRLRKSATSDLR